MPREYFTSKAGSELVFCHSFSLTYILSFVSDYPIKRFVVNSLILGKCSLKEKNFLLGIQSYCDTITSGLYKWVVQFSLSHVITSVFSKEYTSESSFLNLWHSVKAGVKNKIFLPIKTLFGTSEARAVTNDDSFESVSRARSVDKLRELCVYARERRQLSKTKHQKSVRILLFVSQFHSEKCVDIHLLTTENQSVAADR